MERLNRYQTSESFLIGGLLAIVGGYLDAYTYICRGHVFANAQTGNIVFFGFSIVQGKWMDVLHYLVMILSFVLGVIVACWVERKLKTMQIIHWRQIVVLLELVLLVVVAFVPSGQWDMAVNMMISFICALQVVSFRKIRGVAMATTMCTGNLRNGTEQIYAFFKTGERTALHKGLKYLTIIALFIVGVIFGTAVTTPLQVWASLPCAGILLFVFALLFFPQKWP